MQDPFLYTASYYGQLHREGGVWLPGRSVRARVSGFSFARVRQTVSCPKPRLRPELDTVGGRKEGRGRPGVSHRAARWYRTAP